MLMAFGNKSFHLCQFLIHFCKFTFCFLIEGSKPEVAKEHRSSQNKSRHHAKRCETGTYQASIPVAGSLYLVSFRSGKSGKFLPPLGVRTFLPFLELFQLVFQFGQPSFLPDRGKGSVFHLPRDLPLQVSKQGFHFFPQGAFHLPGEAILQKLKPFFHLVPLHGILAGTGGRR